MKNISKLPQETVGMDSATMLRSVKRVLLARKWIIIGLTLLTFALTAVGTWMTKRVYVASASILVKKERIDAPVTPEQTIITSPERLISEEELYSEMELVRSAAVLEDVVTKLQMDRESGTSQGLLSRIEKAFHAEPLSARARALQSLQDSIGVEILKKSNVIRVSYQSTDQGQSAQVVNTICKVYQEHHAQIHHTQNSNGFFSEQALSARTKLAETEAALRYLSPLPNGQLINDQLAMQLKQLSEFEGNWQTTRAAVTESEARIRAIQSQLDQEPVRLVTEERVAQRAAPDAIRSQLFALEMKRTELLTKYQPTHRLIQDVDGEIVEAKKLVSEVESKPTENLSVTSFNTVRQRLLDTLATERASLASLHEKERSLAATVRDYTARVNTLGARSFERRRLDRDREMADQLYSLYARKGEEGRISGELDREGILNVRVVDPARVPLKPISPNVIMNLALGLVGGLIIGLIAAYLLELFSPTPQPFALVSRRYYFGETNYGQ